MDNPNFKNANISETIRAKSFEFGESELALRLNHSKMSINLEEPMTIGIGLSNPQPIKPTDCRPAIVMSSKGYGHVMSWRHQDRGFVV